SHTEIANVKVVQIVKTEGLLPITFQVSSSTSASLRLKVSVFLHIIGFTTGSSSLIYTLLCRWKLLPYRYHVPFDRSLYQFRMCLLYLLTTLGSYPGSQIAPRFLSADF